MVAQLNLKKRVQVHGVLSALMAGLFLFLEPLHGAPKQPNIVFILADDLGWQDVGFMGSKWFETPALDKLAGQSLVLNQAYMYPTCSPSRAALLTGEQSFRTGIYTVPVLEKGGAGDNLFSHWTVGLEHTVFAKPLKGAGYKSIHLGKWHIVGPDPLEEMAMPFPFKKKLTQPANGDLSWLPAHLTPEIQRYYPVGRGFDENVGGTWWGDPARGKEKGYRDATGGYVAPYDNPFIVEKKKGEWLSDRLTSEAIDFMERHKDGPFLVNLDFYAPHKPVVVAKESWMKGFMEKPGDPVTGHGMGNAKAKKEIAAYATMVKSIDANVQRIIDFLDKNHLRENTLVIFTSDNGANRPSATELLRGGKGEIYEGGIRVPALINWPGKVVPRVSEVPICAMDYFPTFLELAGVTGYKGTLDGSSLVPLFKDDAGFPGAPLVLAVVQQLQERCLLGDPQGQVEAHPISQRRAHRTLRSGIRHEGKPEHGEGESRNRSDTRPRIECMAEGQPCAASPRFGREGLTMRALNEKIV